MKVKRRLMNVDFLTFLSCIISNINAVLLSVLYPVINNVLLGLSFLQHPREYWASRPLLVFFFHFGVKMTLNKRNRKSPLLISYQKIYKKKTPPHPPPKTPLSTIMKRTFFPSYKFIYFKVFLL